MTRRRAKQRPRIERFPDRSLDDLEGRWGDAPSGSTNLVVAAHRLHAKPLRELTDEELRLALSQQIGFPWTLALALSRLEEEPLREGEMYPADLLCAALRLPEDRWTAEQRDRLNALESEAVKATAADGEYEHLRRIHAEKGA